VAHPYPPRWRAFSYVGRHTYALTFVTNGRARLFVETPAVDLVWQHLLAAGRKTAFTIVVCCFMPDHVHLLATGQHEGSDGKAFITAAKQHSGYYFSRMMKRRLWERYGHDRVIRHERELAFTIGYVLANPVRAGLCRHPGEYPFIRSGKYTLDELLQWCEYSEAFLL